VRSDHGRLCCLRRTHRYDHYRIEYRSSDTVRERTRLLLLSNWMQPSLASQRTEIINQVSVTRDLGQLIFALLPIHVLFSSLTLGVSQAWLRENRVTAFAEMSIASWTHGVLLTLSLCGTFVRKCDRYERNTSLTNRVVHTTHDCVFCSPNFVMKFITIIEFFKITPFILIHS